MSLSIFPKQSYKALLKSIIYFLKYKEEVDFNNDSSAHFPMEHCFIVRKGSDINILESCSSISEPSFLSFKCA